MSRVAAVAWFSFRELVRSKLLVVWLLAVGLLCAVAYLLAYLSYGEPLRIFMDLGLAGLEAAGLVVLLLELAVTYNTDMEQKAVFLQLTKPLTRGEYLLGRVLGFWMVNTLVLLGMALFIGGFIALHHGHYPLFWAAAALVMLQMFLLTTLGLAYQMIATSMVGTVLFTFFTSILGHAVSQIRWVLDKKPDPIIRFLLNVTYYLLPNLEVFNLKDRLYDPTLNLATIPLGDIALYAFGYSFAAFLVGWWALEKREFH